MENVISTTSLLIEPIINTRTLLGVLQLTTDYIVKELFSIIIIDWLLPTLGIQRFTSQYGRADPKYGNIISDDQLSTLDIKDLNRILRDQGLPKETIEKLKQRRRTLKNRKYATDCREKKDTEVSHLQETQSDETSTIEELEVANSILQKEIDELKRRYQAVVRHAKVENIRITERNVPLSGLSSNTNAQITHSS
ncbi:MAFF_G_K [Lepeophtheirus salmonis]|uniref:MAFF_G_K n=1 Tax=Lepeophtheirus salmonis TaxID=72036 RepID=A0A7R8H8W9_LEPSM|nr:MAFF_G_K [Lepeophtheirus salmonis]CAF2938670.1 MAFF_G_K [Lepeophtheirus salmonis]